MNVPRFALACLVVLASCADDPTAPCTQCLDVNGRFNVNRTVVSADSCAESPPGGAVAITVSQTGSQLGVEYDGDHIRATLRQDGSVDGDSLRSEHKEPSGAYGVTKKLTGGFSEAGGAVRANLKVVETRTPVDPATNKGRTCTLTLSLDGTR